MPASAETCGNESTQEAAVRTTTRGRSVVPEVRSASRPPRPAASSTAATGSAAAATSVGSTGWKGTAPAPGRPGPRVRCGRTLCGPLPARDAAPTHPPVEGRRPVETAVTEIAPDVYRLSTYVPEADFQFNQYLVAGAEPLLFHTGPRAMFPLVAEAVARVLPVEELRWITFGHVEADECGAMNAWLAAAPRAEVAHGRHGVPRAGRRPGRPPAPAPGRRRGHRRRRPARPAHRHPARAARVGRRGAVRGDHRHAAVRRPVHRLRREPGASPSRTSSARRWPPRTCSAPPA